MMRSKSSNEKPAPLVDGIDFAVRQSVKREQELMLAAAEVVVCSLWQRASNMPKESTAALLSEGKTHLLRLLQEIPLGEAVQAAVEDGLAAYENLLSTLSNVPTRAGPTPRRIGAELIQITSMRQPA
jgi:hypothetical protein